jgi:hypothetical protein
MLALSLTNYSLRHEDLWESWCVVSRILYLGTRVVSFTLQPLCSRIKSLLYQSDRWSHVPQERSGQR